MKNYDEIYDCLDLQLNREVFLNLLYSKPTTMMQHELGKLGEERALRYLESNEFELLAKNFRWKHEEIDLIGIHESQLVVVEVKLRSSNYRVAPIQAVSRTKQRHLISATNAFIRERGLDLDVRFDVVSILYKGGNMELEHIKSAFYPTL